ncbi:hypothetical protein DXV76_18630 [Rhodobacteraceae bacterium CCMM004]|nr:hypothetical protein DXV76_18630 [Rhodobacteraceae bacterium CCMM004]
MSLPPGTVFMSNIDTQRAPNGMPIPAEMQARLERIYIDKLALTRDRDRLRAVQPILCFRPERAGLASRVLMRIVPAVRAAYHLRILRGCGLLDRDWYLAKNPDVAAGSWDPVDHYYTHGAGERRDPGPHFSTGHYLDLYPDISGHGINPLVHYILAGHAEGRSIRPDMPHRAIAAPTT